MSAILTDKEFEMFKKLIYDECGITLSASKKNLVQSRLQKRLREKGYNSFFDYYHFVTKDPSREELVHMIDCISTNKTYFFRESKHFDFLVNRILPDLFKTKRNSTDKTIRIWSAGCSTGEEAYTLAMLLYCQLENNRNIKAKILATDISTNVLSKAMTAVYGDEQMKDMPPAYTKRFFSTVHEGHMLRYKVKDVLKEMVTFRRLNLLELKPIFNNKFDVIFCRNVMIYFDYETRHELIKKYYNMLTPNGFFFLSHSETLSGKDHNFKFIEPAVYQKQ